MDRGTILLSCRVDAPLELGAAYDMYAVGLYDYCCWYLRDSRLAEDAVHNALLAAAGRGLLPVAPGQVTGVEQTEAEPLRAWIYAAARNECLRLTPFAQRASETRRAAGDLGDDLVAGGTRLGRFTTAPGYGAPGYGAPGYGASSYSASGAAFGGPGSRAPQPTRAELWQLVRLRRVLDQFSAAEQEIAELAFRHGFGSAALAAIVGRPLSRIRRTVAEIYGRLASECDDGVAATFAVPPFPSPPASLRRLVLDAATAPARLTHLARRHGPYTRLGFPKPVDRRRRIRPIAAAAVGAGAAVLLSTVLMVRAADSEPTGTLHTSARHARPPAAAPATETPVAELPAASPSAVLPPSPTAEAPRPRVTKSALAVQPPARRPLTRATPVVPVAPPSLAARIGFGYDLASRTWNATLTATVRNAEVREVAFSTWWVDADGRHDHDRQGVATDRGAYRANIGGLPYGPVACTQATAALTDGRMVTSPVASAITDRDGNPWCGSPRLGRKNHTRPGSSGP